MGPRNRDQAARLASDVAAITALPARWVGAPADRIADDVAAALHHLSGRLVFVGVRLILSPTQPVEAHRPVGSGGGARWWKAREDEPRLVVAANETSIPIGSMGRHGEILMVGAPGVPLHHERLLGVIAANQLENACRALDLERDVAQAHEKLAALGKLGALGQLVGGVAHEVRTPLTYATNNLYALEAALRRAHGPQVVATAKPHLQEVENAIDRINAIVRQLRKFAKQEVATQLHEDMRDLIRDALRLWRATHTGSSDIRERLQPTCPVMVDRGQLQQVVLNLVQNAVDAAGCNGTISIESSEQGAHALLAVEDDGPGMGPDVLGNLFQPFHTTKRDGLGLGLSIVRGIVEAHHGSIRIDSVLGRGTRVEVRIPRAPPAV